MLRKVKKGEEIHTSLCEQAEIIKEAKTFRGEEKREQTSAMMKCLGKI